MKTREVAEHIVNDWMVCNTPDVELIDAIEAALKARDQRASKIVKDEIGWDWEFDEDSDRPTQVCHINAERSLAAIANAILDEERE